MWLQGGRVLLGRRNLSGHAGIEIPQGRFLSSSVRNRRVGKPDLRTQSAVAWALRGLTNTNGTADLIPRASACGNAQERIPWCSLPGATIRGGTRQKRRPADHTLARPRCSPRRARKNLRRNLSRMAMALSPKTPGKMALPMA